jgi:hypothetical protein
VVFIYDRDSKEVKDTTHAVLAIVSGRGRGGYRHRPTPQRNMFVASED